MLKISRIFLPVLCLILPVTAQVNTERFRQDADSTGFSGHVDLTATVSTGNTSYRHIAVGSRLNYNWGEDYTFLVSDIGYTRERDKKIFDQMFFHLRNVFAVNRHLQHEMFVQYDFNKKRKLSARKLIGTGLRFRLLKKGPFKFRVGLSYMYEIEDYDLPDQSSHEKHAEAHRLSNYETFEFAIDKNLTLLSVTYFQPEIGKWDDIKIISENALIIDAGKHLDVTIKYNLRYDSRPPDATEELDTISTFGIAFKF
ncbi:DUF481 domain-containing protein [candidate division KSB1 bacterium]|nr:DUF481 domain-containing protein [candidate division KSB1 bacterium]